MSVYVGNLSYEVTQDALTAVFAEYGTVKRVQIPTDRETGRVRGFAFVEMGTDAEETAAIEALDGAEWMGRDLKVNKAKPKEDRGGSFGGGGGGGGRGGYGGGGGGGGGRSRY
jgi:RNA recognition motif-containing protein